MDNDFWVNSDVMFNIMRSHSKSMTAMTIGMAVIGIYALAQRSKCKLLEFKLQELNKTEGE